MQQNTDFSNHGRDSRNKSRITEESEQSQSDHITYDDPDGRMEREKIMANIKKEWENNTSDMELQRDNDKTQEEDNDAVVGAVNQYIFNVFQNCVVRPLRWLLIIINK